jgi:hypothetical protein
MDQAPIAAAAPAPARYKPVLSAEHRALIERHGVRSLMLSLCLYAFEKADEASRDGLTGAGWYDLGGSIDEIVPADEDALWGEEFEPFVPCRSCRTGGEVCTC